MYGLLCNLPGKMEISDKGKEDRGDREEDSCYLAVVNNFKFSPNNKEAP